MPSLKVSEKERKKERKKEEFASTRPVGFAAGKNGHDHKVAQMDPFKGP